MASLFGSTTPALLLHLATPLAMIFAASWMTLLIHEAGHAAAAMLVGVRLWGVRLGSGPVLFNGSILGFQVRLALLPLRGGVQLLDADAIAIGYRDVHASKWRFTWVRGAWRAPLISAAGPAANLIAGVVMLTILAPQHSAPTGLSCLAAGNLAGWLNLMPFEKSDGLHVARQLAALRLRLG